MAVCPFIRLTPLLLCLFCQMVLAPDSKARNAVSPCFTCTLLNRVKCCQLYNKCCGNTSMPNDPLVVGPDNSRRHLCPVANELAAIIHSCTQRCSSDVQCIGINTRCCPPPVLCCQRLQGRQCPASGVPTGSCRNCVTDYSCRLGEGCCSQPGHSGCCTCVGSQCPPRPGTSTPPSISTSVSVQTVTTTVTAPAPPASPASPAPAAETRKTSTPSEQPSPSSNPSPSIAPTTPPPSSTQSGTPQVPDVIEEIIYVDDNGVETTRTETIRVIKEGSTVVIYVDEEGKTITTPYTEPPPENTEPEPTQTVQTTATENPESEVEHFIEDNNGIETTYTLGPDNKETGWFTTTENGEAVVYETVRDVQQSAQEVVVTQVVTETVSALGIDTGIKEMSLSLVDGDHQLDEESIVTSTQPQVYFSKSNLREQGENDGMMVEPSILPSYTQTTSKIEISVV